MSEASILLYGLGAWATIMVVGFLATVVYPFAEIYLLARRKGYIVVISESSAWVYCRSGKMVVGCCSHSYVRQWLRLQEH